MASQAVGSHEPQLPLFKVHCMVGLRCKLGERTVGKGQRSGPVTHHPSWKTWRAGRVLQDPTWDTY
jgi:hypothetical protein